MYGKDMRLTIETVIRAVFMLSGVFLLIDGVRGVNAQAYWSVFVNVIFILIAVYFVAIYPRRKLYLNQDLTLIMMVFFVGLAMRSLIIAEYMTFFIASGMLALFTLTIISRRKNPYQLN